MGNKPKNRMDIGERAKQFTPFAALKGLPEALAERERIVVPKIELTEDMASQLDRKMQQVEPGKRITVVYFQGYEYLKIAGMAARIDKNCGFLQIVDTRIRFSDILDIDISYENGTVERCEEM